MSLLEAIPEHMRQGLLEELQQWAALKEEIEQRLDSREAELAHIRKCLETGAPLTPLNRAGKTENLKEDANSRAMVSPNKKKPLKQP